MLLRRGEKMEKKTELVRVEQKVKEEKKPTKETYTQVCQGVASRQGRSAVDIGDNRADRTFS
jgi:hypothetical protein